MSARAQSLLEAFESGGAPVGGRRREDPLATSFENGRAEGLTEGVLAGRAQGLEEGRAEGRQTGYAEGREKGRLEGRAEIAEERDASLASLAAAFADLQAHRADVEKRFAAAAAQTLRAAVAAVTPRLARRGLADEVAAIAQEIAAAAAQGAATLHVAAEHEEAAREALRAAAAASIDVSVETALSAGAARLEWRDGMMEFDGDRAAASVIERLDAALSKATDSSSGSREPATAGGAEELV